MFDFLLDNRSRSFRIECILYQDRNISMTSRIDSRWIYNLCTKVTKFHSFHITQLIDDIRITDDTRVCGHETVHICPNFQHIGLQSSCNNGSCIIRATTTKVGNLTTVLVGRDKTRNQCHLWQFLKGFSYQFVSQVRIQNMSGMLSFCLDESA